MDKNNDFNFYGVPQFNGNSMYDMNFEQPQNPNNINSNYNNKSINITNIIRETTNTLLMILGTLIFFNIIINLIPIKNLLLKNIINGFLEITTALSSMKYINIANILFFKNNL